MGGSDPVCERRAASGLKICIGLFVLLLALAAPVILKKGPLLKNWIGCREMGRLPIELIHRISKRPVVYLIPYIGAPGGDALIEGRHKRLDYDDRAFWVLLKQCLAQRGIELHCTQLHRVPLDAELVIVTGFRLPQRALECLDALPREKKILLAIEPPTYEPFCFIRGYHPRFFKVITWNDDLIDNKTFLKFHLPHNLHPILEPKPYKTRKLATLINGNGCSSYPGELFTERRRVIEFFERLPPGEFTYYGSRWAELHHRNYAGYAQDKLATLSDYRFAICYENCNDLTGYVSEKILDCFLAHCVPIYWGAPNIEAYVPAECFIDRRAFESNEALYNFIKSMDEERYQSYLKAIDAFLQSDEIEVFSHKRVAEGLANDISAILCELKSSH